MSFNTPTFIPNPDRIAPVGTGHNQAKKLGYLYYHGQPCKNDHTIRYVSNGACICCLKRNDRIREFGINGILGVSKTTSKAIDLKEDLELKKSLKEVWD